MRVGILGALDEEVRLIREKMEVTASHEVYGTTFYLGKAMGRDIVLACCGVGKVNAAACASVIMREFGAQCVINVGIAGATGRGLGVMDVVISDKAVFHDQDAVMLKYYPKTEYFMADAGLCALADKVCSDQGLRYRVGTIASGDVFVNDTALKARIVERYQPQCVEMEGAAIAHVAFMNHTPFLILRTMSDAADDGANETYDNFVETAALRSAGIVLAMLEQMA